MVVGTTGGISYLDYLSEKVRGVWERKTKIRKDGRGGE